MIRAIQIKETMEHFRPRYAVEARMESAYVKNLTGVSALIKDYHQRLMQVELVVSEDS
jgi:hypothetical protein